MHRRARLQLRDDGIRTFLLSLRTDLRLTVPQLAGADKLEIEPLDDLLSDIIGTYGVQLKAVGDLPPVLEKLKEGWEKHGAGLADLEDIEGNLTWWLTIGAFVCSLTSFNH